MSQISKVFALLLTPALLLGCAGADGGARSGTALFPGVWRGDIAADDAPIGALFHITESEAGTAIRLETMFIQHDLEDVVVEGHGLSFTWPLETPRQCLLRHQDTDGWQGSCLAEGTNPVDLWLVPPIHPAVPTGLARAAYESGLPWIEDRFGRLHVLVQDGGPSAAHAARLFESAVFAFDSAFAVLEETPPDVPFWIIYVDSRKEIQQLAGWPVGGAADPIARAAVSGVTEDGRAPDRHEMMHVASTVAWGVPEAPWMWINEGLATYASGECGGARIHPLAAALMESGEAAPLYRLIHHFRDIDEVSAYLQAASVVGYIREVFGMGAVRRIWQEGPAAVPAATGRSIEELDRDWRAFSSSVPAATAALERVHERGCL